LEIDMPQRLYAVALALAISVCASAADAKPLRQQQLFYDNNGRITTNQTQPEYSPGRQASYDRGQIVAHPVGCQRRLFCGCGVSVKAFGKPIRELFLARNWGYYFNPAPFASGNVAWSYGHVVYILGGTRSAALLYDPNSGGGKTRVHVRNISRYYIVDPNSPKRRLAAR
jgi:hypothetical protein